MSTSSSAEQIAKAAKEAFELSQKLLPGGAEADRVRSDALLKIREELEKAKDAIQEANRLDMEAAREQVQAGKLSASLAARLDLFSKPGKWESMLQGLNDVASLPSPLDVCTYARRLADPSPSTGAGALDLYRLTCPIGVLLCIFEARPEVIVNIASLSLKSGNAAILKGGKESKHTAAVISKAVHSALSATMLPPALVQTIETRQDVADLLHQDKYVDLVVPRGSNELVKSIQREARMPVMGHADGLCIIYVHDDALEKGTIESIVDAKTDYPAACNAVETLLINRAQLTKPLWKNLATALLSSGVTLHCDEACLSALGDVSSAAHGKAKVIAAVPEDYHTEFLDLDLAVKVVDSVDEAIDHINEHSSHHTDAIFCAPIPSTSSSSSGGHPAAEKFTRALSSTSVFVNVSTRFADGFRFGFGAEVGISTGRYHARGPVGLEGLTIYKYIARAEGEGPQTAAGFNPGKGRTWAHREIEKAYPTF